LSHYAILLFIVMLLGASSDWVFPMETLLSI
jgi:hypothetical protein